jgi:hypothetical protein
MPDTLISRVEKLTDEQLDAELASHEHNDIGRHIILAEKSRRTVLRSSKPRWIDWAILVVSVFAAVFAFLQWRDSRRPADSTVVASVTPAAPDYGLPPTEACRQAIRDHYHRQISPKLVFTFKDAAQTSVDDPDRPGQKIHGWLFEATWNFGPDSQSNFPMAARFVTRSDTIVLYAPIGAAFQRWTGEERRP